MHFFTNFGANIFIQTANMNIFFKKINMALPSPSWIFTVGEFGTIRRDCS